MLIDGRAVYRRRYLRDGYEDKIESIVQALRTAGYADADIQWSENCGPPACAEDFTRETIFVICNSGMKNTVARGFFDRVRAALARGGSARTVFNHPGKARAIDDIWARREGYFAGFLAAADPLEYCASIPWVGPITKYHLAKNFGAQVAKLDVPSSAALAALELDQRRVSRFRGNEGSRAGAEALHALRDTIERAARAMRSGGHGAFLDPISTSVLSETVSRWRGGPVGTFDALRRALEELVSLLQPPAFDQLTNEEIGSLRDFFVELSMCSRNMLGVARRWRRV